MIQEIRVKNYMSFRDEATLSFEATDDTFDLERQTVEVAPNVRLLRFATIYGANASGKSNFLNAIGLLRGIYGNIPQLKDTLNTIPFLFDDTSRNEPTCITIIGWIKFDQYRQYQYDVEINNDTIIKEKLVFATITIFERSTDNKGVSTLSDIFDLSDEANAFARYSCTKNRSVINIVRSLNLNNGSTRETLCKTITDYICSDIDNNILDPSYPDIVYIPVGGINLKDA